MTRHAEEAEKWNTELHNHIYRSVHLVKLWPHFEGLETKLLLTTFWHEKALQVCF